MRSKLIKFWLRRKAEKTPNHTKKAQRVIVLLQCERIRLECKGPKK